MASSFTIAQNTSAPKLTDTLTSGGVVLDLTGASVKFQMRQVTGAVLALDKTATIVTAASGKVEYSWSTSDTATAGEYIAWWKITFPTGKVQTTIPEFTVTIDGHDPGVGTETGEIADQARQIMPITWSALSGDTRYGDRMLQTRVNYVKYKLFSTICNVEDEVTLYNPLVIDYVAKNVALQIIPAGIEYWMSQQNTISTTGTQESVSYPDRIGALEKTQEWLTLEITRLRPELEGLFTVRRKGNYPKVSNESDLRTPNPTDFPKQTEPNSTAIPWRSF